MRTSIASVIDFRAGCNARAVQGSGWSVAEVEHTWAIGARSTLSLEAPQAPHGYFLEIDWTPLLCPPLVPAQFVAVSVDGKIVWRSFVVRAGTVALRCPQPADHAARIQVTFEHPDGFRPSDLFGQNDARQMSLAFHRIRILPLLEPWPTALLRSSSLRIRGETVEEVAREAERAAGNNLRETFGAFEMLAGNCDMGLAMRAFGYESLSLLRFGGAGAKAAQRGLETDFSGIGERIDADVADNPQREWMIDDALGLRVHSGQSSLNTEKSQVLKRFGPYARRLARKLIEDVEEGTKTFVVADHRDLSATLTPEEVMPLFLSLRRRGGRRMLWVRAAGGESRAPGSVMELLPGLAQANLEVLAAPLTSGGSITLSGWATVLVNALQVFGEAHA
jgi:hypothetical protein